MKELEIELNKIKSIKNEFNQTLKIGRNNNGYFIIDDKVKRGPFEKVFLSRKEDFKIVGYTASESKIYELNEDGLKLKSKEELKLDDLEKNDELQNCKLLGVIDNYSVYMDNDDEKFFAVKVNSLIKSPNEYRKFDSYTDLADFYVRYQVYLYDSKINSSINKEEKYYINFNLLYDIADKLDVNKCPEELAFDIIAKRNIKKSVYNFAKDKITKRTFVDYKGNKYLKHGYLETKSISFEGVVKGFPEESKKYFDLLESKLSVLEEESLKKLKNTPVDFDELIDNFNNISINDLPKAVREEIGDNRPLTPQIFTGLLEVAIAKSSMSNLNDCYKKHINFKTLYPEQHDILWAIANEKLPVLFKEYYKERAKKRTTVLK